MWLLQIHIEYRGAFKDLRRDIEIIVERSSAASGLAWKTWGRHASRPEVGCVYLFETRGALEAYLGGPLLGSIGGHPAVRDLTTRTLEILDARRTPPPLPLSVDVWPNLW